MTLSIQWLTVAVMLLSGLGMGVVFDGYRVVSNELRFPRWWLPILDVVYWMAAALVVFRVLYASNNGEVRAYVFIGLALGALTYYWLFSKLVIIIVKWIIQAIRSLISFTLKLLDFVIVKPVFLLYKLFKIILSFGTILTIFLLKIVLQLALPVWKLLFWLLQPAIRPIRRKLSPWMDKWKPAATEKLRKLGAIATGWWNKWFRR